MHGQFCMVETRTALLKSRCEFSIPRRQARSDRLMDRRIRRVTSVLDQQYKDPPSIEQLAGAVGLSASRLSHLFRNETGTSIQGYVLERRLVMAAMLIAQTDEQISQIAYRVGFGDVSNFNHSFKRRFGMSPREYRARHDVSSDPAFSSEG